MRAGIPIGGPSEKSNPGLQSEWNSVDKVWFSGRNCKVTPVGLVKVCIRVHSWISASLHLGGITRCVGVAMNQWMY